MINNMEKKSMDKTLSYSQQPIASPRSSKASSIVEADEATSRTQPNQNELSTPPIEVLRGARLYGILGAMVLVTLMFSLDSLVLATAIPKITDDFHTIADIGWYPTAYMLCNSALQPLTGKVYSYFNLTYSYLCFIFVFEIGSIVCASAPTSNAFILGRAIAGLGGSGVVNGAMTILGVAAPPEQRPVLMGVLMGIMGLGQIIAPLIGGALSEYASWRWCFWINLPCGVAAAITFFILRVPNPNVREGLTLKTFIKKFDIVGFLVFAPACVMILLALQWGGNSYAWGSATIIGLICGAVAAFVIFIIWEYRQDDDAMFPRSIIGQRIVYSSCFTAAFTFGSMFVVGYYLALWFQAIKRTSPTMSAVSTLPSFALQIIGVVFSSALVNRVGFFTPFAVPGNILTALGTGLMTIFVPSTGIGEWFGFQILTGIGRGLTFQQPVNAIQASLTGRQMSTGMAIIAWSQFFGGAVFIGVAQTLFTNLLRGAIREAVPSIDPETIIHAGATDYLGLAPTGPIRDALLHAYNKAITQTFYLPTALAVVGTFTALGMGWKRVLKAKPKAKAEKDAGSGTIATEA